MKKLLGLMMLFGAVFIHAEVVMSSFQIRQAKMQGECVDISAKQCKITSSICKKIGFKVYRQTCFQLLRKNKYTLVPNSKNLNQIVATNYGSSLPFEKINYMLIDTTDLKYYKTLNEAYKINKGKKPIVLFVMDNCPYCKKMLINSFSNKEIIRILNNDFIVVISSVMNLDKTQYAVKFTPETWFIKNEKPMFQVLQADHSIKEWKMIFSQVKNNF